MTDPTTESEALKPHRYSFGDFNPFNMLMFFLLLWSIFSGILGFFIGRMFDSTNGDWVPSIIWVAFAICIPLLTAVLMFRYFHFYKVVKVEGSSIVDSTEKEAIAASDISPEDESPLMADESEDESEEGPESSSASKKGWFSARCNNIASRYLLSKRETEVLFLLAKGHNAAFIQDQLCVSRSTAKTHINHIYRKLDIHTQQELLNMVENGPKGLQVNQPAGPALGSMPGVVQLQDQRVLMEQVSARRAKSSQKNYRKDIFAQNS